MYQPDQLSDHTRELQEYLRLLAMTDERYPLLGVDGIFGPQTTEAVKVFQTVTDSPVTGTVKRADWERIVREYEALLTVLAPPTPIAAFPSPIYVVQRGTREPIVSIVQVMLGAVTPDPLPVTGIYDAATAERVRTLQEAADLPATGEIDRITWDYLTALYNDRS